MKKLLMLMFSAVAVFALAGCADDSSDSNGGGETVPPVVKPDGKYNLTKFPLVQTASTNLETLPFVLKFPESTGGVSYITAEGKEESFIRTNDDLNDPDKTQLPFEQAGGGADNEAFGHRDMLVQLSKNSLEKNNQDQRYAEKLEILLNNNLTTEGIENLGKFNEFARGFGTLTQNAETKLITFSHNEEFLFADAEKALAEISTVTNNNGEYSFTFKEAIDFITTDEEYYLEAPTKPSGTVTITAKKIGDVYISYPTIENIRGVSSDAYITMNDIVPVDQIVFSANASENVKATAGLNVTVTKSADTYTVKVTNGTAAEIKDAKVQVVIGKSGIVAKTISLGDVPAKQ